MSGAGPRGKPANPEGRRTMANGVERRHFARLTIPARFRDYARQIRPVRLLELSAGGARVEHRAPLYAGLLCVVDLQPALGQGSLTGRIVWTTLCRDEQPLEGERQIHYRSGLTWTGLTRGQQERLATALEILKAVQQG